MSNTQSCIFCKIIKKELPSYQLYEDADYVAFLDITPRVIGHTLLIPKIHVRWVYDIPQFEQFWTTALKITHAVQKALSPEFVTYVTHGLEVEHAHLHILPRKKSDTALVPSPIAITKTEYEEVAKKIRKCF